MVKIDFEAAFLQSEVDGDIYIKLSKFLESLGFKVPHGYVVKLRKALYGLKQSAMLWAGALAHLLAKLGFKRSLVDPALWIYRKNNAYMTMTTWVDDVAVCYDNEDDAQSKLKKRIIKHLYI